jgi:hypothetical protein
MHGMVIVCRRAQDGSHHVPELAALKDIYAWAVGTPPDTVSACVGCHWVVPPMRGRTPLVVWACMLDKCHAKSPSPCLSPSLVSPAPLIAASIYDAQRTFMFGVSGRGRVQHRMQDGLPATRVHCRTEREDQNESCCATDGEESRVSRCGAQHGCRAVGLNFIHTISRK